MLNLALCSISFKRHIRDCKKLGSCDVLKLVDHRKFFGFQLAETVLVTKIMIIKMAK